MNAGYGFNLWLWVSSGFLDTFNDMRCEGEPTKEFERRVNEPQGLPLRQAFFCFQLRSSLCRAGGPCRSFCYLMMSFGAASAPISSNFDPLSNVKADPTKQRSLLTTVLPLGVSKAKADVIRSFLRCLCVCMLKVGGFKSEVQHLGSQWMRVEC
jgi:hypothetical protein